MTLATLPTAPQGFSILTEGVVRPGDLVWNPYNESWGGPTQLDIDCLGRDVPAYYAVARKVRDPAR